MEFRSKGELDVSEPSHTPLNLICLDAANECVWRGFERVPLRPKTFALLRYLIEHPSRLVSKDELLQAVWPNTYVCDSVVKESINEIRKALGDDVKSPQFIETVHRRGYRFIGKIRIVAPRSPLVGRERVVTIQPQPATRDQPRTVHLVGRKSELAKLQGCLETALTGKRQVVFVTGEAGIGKTTLVDAFLEIVSAGTGPQSRTPNRKPGIYIARGQCLESHGAGEAYMPVLEALGQLCHEPGGDQVVSLLRQHAPMWLLQMPSLLGAADLELLQQMTLGANRRRMLREMAQMLEVMTAQMPLVLVLEDLHWSDYSTVNLISYLAQRREPARLLLIGTYRREEVMGKGHPLKSVKQELQGHRQCEEMVLSFLSEPEVGEYLARRFSERELSPRLARLVYERTEGNPFFMVNVVDYLVSQGLILEKRGRGEVSSEWEKIEVGVPETIQQMIERQIARCSREEERVLEAASVAGLEFSSVEVAAALEEKEDRIEEVCEGLVQRQHFLRSAGLSELPDGRLTGRYRFIHVLYQDVFYHRLGATRRASLHLRIGDQIEKVWGEGVGEMAAKLAMHFERGRDHRRAISYYHRAAENALRRFAEYEAEALARRGLELVRERPDSPERADQELRLHITLGVALMSTKGFGALEVKRTYTRARELCQHLGERASFFTVLWGLWRCYHMRADLVTARELAEHLLELAEGEEDKILLVEAHWAMGATLVDLGEFAPALEYLDQGIALHERQPPEKSLFLYGHNPGMTCRGFGAVAQWILGYPEKALKKVEEALALAQELRQAETLADALFFSAWVYKLRQESQKALEHAEALMAHAEKHGLVQYTAFGKGLRGWALAKEGQVTKGIEQMREALAEQRAIGAEVSRLHFLAELAELSSEAGQIEEGVTAVAEALHGIQTTGGRYYEAELYRLKGDLLLKSALTNPQSPICDVQSEAEAWFHRAIEVARQQEARSFELRATMSLARLWQKQGKAAEARQRLHQIYDSFTEGHDTLDLKEAQALLHALS